MSEVSSTQARHQQSLPSCFWWRDRDTNPRRFDRAKKMSQRMSAQECSPFRHEIGHQNERVKTQVSALEDRHSEIKKTQRAPVSPGSRHSFLARLRGGGPTWALVVW